MSALMQHGRVEINLSLAVPSGECLSVACARVLSVAVTSLRQSQRRRSLALASLITYLHHRRSVTIGQPDQKAYHLGCYQLRRASVDFGGAVTKPQQQVLRIRTGTMKQEAGRTRS